MKNIILLVFFIVAYSEVNAANDSKTPMMGWSSWNTYRVDINEALIRKQADAMVSTGLKDCGYNYINIDDGFFGGRDENGNMLIHSRHFPDGLRVVSDYIHGLGLNAGIYGEAGHNTCGSMYDNDPLGVGSGMYGHEDADACNYFIDWNFDFIKIDYCGGRELGLDEKDRYTAIVDAIHRVGRDDVRINICRWAFPGTWAKDLAGSWRISEDIAPNWKSIKSIIYKNLYLAPYASRGHYNDMDMLEVGRGMTDNEDKLHFGIWCLMSSPLLIGCDLTTIKPETLELLKNTELIALNQDSLGIQAAPVWRDDDLLVLAKDLYKKRGSVRAVAFVNMSDSTARFDIPVQELGFTGRCKVRDLINRRDMPVVKDRFIYIVEPHSALIIKADGEKRVEPTRYEGENAYLAEYDALGKNPMGICHIHDESCSGGMKVGRIGGRKENFLKWDNVYTIDGGQYEMEIFYTSPGWRTLNVDVNGTVHQLKALRANEKGRTASVKLIVNLRQGENMVSMVTPYDWSPDIDCFTLTKL